MMPPELKKQRKSVFLRMLHDIQKLFGPGPILATESEQSYNRVMLQFIVCIVPRDFAEQMFVKHLTDNAWYMLRYMRYQTVYVEWKRNQLCDARAQSGKAAQAPTEFDYAEAIERGIDPIRYLDNLLNTATVRYNETLAQVERYREGLARDLSFVSNKIIREHRPDPWPLLAQPEMGISHEQAELLGLGPEMVVPESSPSSELENNEASSVCENNAQSVSPGTQTKATISQDIAEFMRLSKEMAEYDPSASKSNTLPPCEDKPDTESLQVNGSGLRNRGISK